MTSHGEFAIELVDEADVELRSFNYRGHEIPQNMIADVLEGQNATIVRAVHIHVVKGIMGPSIPKTFNVFEASTILPFQSENTIYPTKWKEPGESAVYIPEKSRILPNGPTFKEISESNLREWYRAYIASKYSDGSIMDDSDAYFKSHVFTIDVRSSYSPETEEKSEELAFATSLFFFNEAEIEGAKEKVRKFSSKASTSGFLSFLSLLRANGFVEGKDYYVTSDETLIGSERLNSVYASKKGKKAIYMSNSILSSKEKMNVILSFNSFIVSIENFIRMKYGDLECVGVGDPTGESPHILWEVIGFGTRNDLKVNQHDLEFSDSRYRAWKAWVFNTGSYLYGHANSLFSDLTKFASGIALDNREAIEETSSSLKGYSRTDPKQPGTLNVYGFYAIQQRSAQPLYSSDLTRNYELFVRDPPNLIAEIQPVGITLDGTEPKNLSFVPKFRTLSDVLLDLSQNSSTEALVIKTRFLKDFANNAVLTSLPPWFVQYSALPNSMVFGEYFHRDEFVFNTRETKNIDIGSFGSIVRTKWRASRTSLFNLAGKLRGSGKHAFNHHNLVLDSLRKKRQNLVYLRILRSNGVDVQKIYKNAIDYVPVESIAIAVLRNGSNGDKRVAYLKIDFNSESDVSDYDAAISYVEQAVCRDCAKKDGRIDVATMRSFGHESFNSIVPSNDLSVIGYDTAVSIDIILKLSATQQQMARREFCIIKALFPKSKVAKHHVETYEHLTGSNLSVQNLDRIRKLSEFDSWAVMTVQDQAGNTSFKIVATPSDDLNSNRVLLSIKLATLKYNTSRNIIIKPSIPTLAVDRISKPYGLGYDASIIFTVSTYQINGDLESFLEGWKLGEQFVPTTPNTYPSLSAFISAQKKLQSETVNVRRPLTLYEFLSIMKDVAVSLNTMNSKGVLYGDMKEKNILVGMAREGILTDFSFSTPYGCPIPYAGTEGYIPPNIGMRDIDDVSKDEMFSVTDTYFDAYGFVVILSGYLREHFGTIQDMRQLSYFGCCYNKNMIQKILGGEVPQIFQSHEDYMCLFSNKIRYLDDSKVLASNAQLTVDFLKMVKDDLTLLAFLMIKDFIGDNWPNNLEESMRTLDRPQERIVTDFGSRELLQKGCNRFYIAELILDYLMQSIVAEVSSIWGPENIIDSAKYESVLHSK